MNMVLVLLACSLDTSMESFQDARLKFQGLILGDEEVSSDY